MKVKPRILLYDIETSLNRGYFFGLFKDITSTEAISHERHIISIAYKWLGDEKGKVITIADFPEYKLNPRCDKDLLEAFTPVWEKADYVIAHYGDGFDIKFIAGRLLINNLPPLPIVPTVDTCKLAKRHFLLNSNKLGYIAQKLGFDGKSTMSFGDWIKIEEGSYTERRAAVKKMGAYNLQDVYVLENVWLKLQPYVTHKINLNLFAEGESEHVCPSCGSSDLQRRGKMANKVTVYQRMFCKSCKGWHSVKMEK